MMASADQLVKRCEFAIQDGKLDDARKLAAGVSILTGQPAWERSYQFLMDGEDIERFIKIDRVTIPEWLAPLLNELHDKNGKQFENQSVRGGTQVNITHHEPIMRWLDKKVIGAWTVRLNTGGYHINHIHPRGGDSAVIYVDVPQDEGGYLQFGVPRYLAKKPMLSIKPKTGMMVSFPCWLWHGVTKFTGKKRLTIAYDV